MREKAEATMLGSWESARQFRNDVNKDKGGFEPCNLLVGRKR